MYRKVKIYRCRLGGAATSMNVRGEVHIAVYIHIRMNYTNVNVDGRGR